MITDNVLLAYEITHHLNSRRRGSEGLAAIKLDMSKAYDRVEWPFLEKMMRKLGFQERWINLIMQCVTTVCYRIKVNGEYTDSFFPKGVCVRVTHYHLTYLFYVHKVFQLYCNMLNL